MVTQPTHLDCVVVEPPGPARGAVIWLHGLGADGHDFEALVPMLELPADHGIRFVFPHAPRRPVTINAGYVMRAWYDVVSADLSAVEDTAGIRASARQIEALVEGETASGLTPQRIVLAGFSQGGAIALHTGLRHAHRLGGIMALSSYLPLADTLAAEASAANQHTPIMMAHGSQDTVIPQQLGERSRDQLRAAGYAVTWHSYPMPHTVMNTEIGDIAAWLQDVLG